MKKIILALIIVMAAASFAVADTVYLRGLNVDGVQFSGSDGIVFNTGRRLTGDEALKIGLVDYLVPLEQVRAKAVEVATEIAGSAPRN